MPVWLIRCKSRYGCAAASYRAADLKSERVDEIEAEMWEIAENLHRAELTVLERSDQIARWLELAAIKVAQIAPPGGEQPKEQGIRKLARQLGKSRRENLRRLEFDRLRAAAYRHRKRDRDALPKHIADIRERGDALIKAAKGLGDG